MSEQTSLFPDLAPVEQPEPPPRLSPDRRRTARQRDAIAAGVHPLTGLPLNPAAGTCGSCAHRYLRDRYPKCDANNGGYETRGPATDVRAWWPACPLHQPRR